MRQRLSTPTRNARVRSPAAPDRARARCTRQTGARGRPSGLAAVGWRCRFYCMWVGLAVAIVALVFTAPAAAGDTGPEYHPIPGVTGLPLSDAVRVGDLLFLSGKLGNKPGTRDLPDGIAAQTRQTMENIKATLERLGGSMERVVKCTVFLADIAEWAAMNEVYKTYFPVNPPARSAVGVSGIALNGRVEIECIAAAPSN